MGRADRNSRLMMHHAVNVLPGMAALIGEMKGDERKIAVGRLATLVLFTEFSLEMEEVVFTKSWFPSPELSLRLTLLGERGLRLLDIAMHSNARLVRLLLSLPYPIQP